MRLSVPGLGLIALGILLLGAQLVLYLGTKNVHLRPGSVESHVGPVHRTTIIPGIFGTVLLAAGLVLSTWSHRQPDDPRDGRSIP